MNLLTQLNPVQQEAVRYTEGPLLVVAGAGSGKTRLLTYRIAYLIRYRQVNPSQIMAVTFTRQAAEEMRNRVVELTHQNLSIGTFHSFCARLLRAEIERIGLSRDFAIFDEEDQLSLMKECFKEMEIIDNQFTPQKALAEIKRAKNELLLPSDFLGNSDFRYQKIGQIYQYYQKKLLFNQALDFGDLILVTVLLLEKYPDILRKYQEKYRYILVDEYQDTNIAQYHLIKLLAHQHKNICVVGDPDQSIYSWRGARMENILNFEIDYPEVKIINLEENYRSTQYILKAANKLITHNFKRLPKKLWTKKKGGTRIKFFWAYDAEAEVNFIVKEIRKLQSEGVKLNEIVLFYRIHSLSRVLEEGLRYHQIPYLIVGGVSFYERREIKDVLAYLRLIANPRDEVSLKRIINLPPRGIGSTTIKKLETYARKKEISMFETLQYHLSDIPSLSPSGKKAIENFTQLIKKYQQKAAQPGVKRMIEEILEEIRYFKMLEKEPPEEAQVRAENLEELISSAAAFENLHPQATLVQYLEEIALLTQIDQWSKEKEMVNLMTLHNAKGLEFRICFIVGLEENIFPHQLSLISSEEIEEERRLCYVGMTRAQEKLYLTAAKNRLLRGQPCYNEISRFIREIKDELEEIEPSKTIKHSSLYLPQADNFYD